MASYNKKSVADVDVKGKKVLLRCDFNVPLDKKSGEITDDGRIVAALPTINYLLEQGAAVIASSHLGRPDGEFNPKYSLTPVAKRLSELLGKPVKFAKDVIGDDAKGIVSALKPGEIALLENLRFHKEEEKNDPGFAKALADFADLYVSDAFGCVHRAHASTEGVSKYLPAVSGFLIAKELKYLGGAISDPARPLVAVMGGSKVSDKIGVLINLLDKTDTLVLGGGMAYTFIKAMGGKIGKSLCEEDRLDYARKVILTAATKGVKILLPIDSIAASELSDEAVPVTVKSDEIPDGLLGLDIGPEAVAIFAKEIGNAGTVIWNGPMGVFENPKFAKGTVAVSYALADSDAVSVIGGGDSAAAIREFGLDYRVTHVSTGGGASMEFLEGKVLPGIACLLDN